MTAKLKRAKGQHGDMNLRDQPDNSISTEYPFTRGWVKFEIKTTTVARSTLPELYFLILPGLGWGVSGHFKQCGSVITAINLLGFQILPKL